MNLIKPFFIVSSDKAELSDLENHRRFHLLYKFMFLWKVKHRLVEGYYKGTKETSFMIEDENVAMNICREYNQECYLAVDANRYCTLNDKEGRVIKTLGLLATSKEKPDRDSYTFIPDLKIYLYTN